jgi:hypothetical protein
MDKTMLKSRMGFGFLVTIAVSLLANTALASPPVPTVPDGGSSALLITIGISALAFGRRLLR